MNKSTVHVGSSGGRLNIAATLWQRNTLMSSKSGSLMTVWHTAGRAAKNDAHLAVALPYTCIQSHQCCKAASSRIAFAL